MHAVLYWLSVRMQIGDLNILFGEHPEIKVIGERLGVRGDKHLLLSGLHASARALTLAHVTRSMFVIFDNAEAAQYLYGDLKAIVESQESRVFFFPAAQKRRAVDEAAMIQRTECLTALSQEPKAKSQKLIIVTYPEAVAEAVPAKEELSAVSMTLKTGETIQQTKLGQQLAELGFERVDFARNRPSVSKLHQVCHRTRSTA